MSKDKTIRVLLCDDSAYGRNQVKRELEKGGMEVIAEAEDAKNSLEKYKTTKPDITIMDLILRGSRGQDAVRDILAFDPHAKILVLTILTSGEELDEIKKLGITDILNKKDMRKDLVQTIKKIIKKGDSA